MKIEKEKSTSHSTELFLPHTMASSTTCRRVMEDDESGRARNGPTSLSLPSRYSNVMVMTQKESLSFSRSGIRIYPEVASLDIDERAIGSKKWNSTLRSM